MCGDTEVALDQLEEYVSDILTVPIDHSEHTHIELQFKVRGRGSVSHVRCILTLSAEAGSGQVRHLQVLLCQ